MTSLCEETEHLRRMIASGRQYDHLIVRPHVKDKRAVVIYGFIDGIGGFPIDTWVQKEDIFNELSRYFKMDICKTRDVIIFTGSMLGGSKSRYVFTPPDRWQKIL